MKLTKVVLLIILGALVLTACGKQGEDTLSEGEYNLYFTNSDGNGLVSEVYASENKDTEKLVQELFKELKTPEGNQQSTVGKNIKISSFSVTDKVLMLYFSDGYKDIKPMREVLMRAAIVKTMVQISGIESVSFYVGDQPLTNSSGAVIGAMTASTFIDDTNELQENISWLETTVYYADSTGKKLVGETIELAYSSSTSIEEVIVDRLKNGPTGKDGNRTVPSNMKILGVSTKDSVCYLNLDSSFLKDVVNVSAEVTLYSIVNSICELPNVNKVQILVDGNTDYSFRETYPLSQAYERNLDIVTSTYKISN